MLSIAQILKIVGLVKDELEPPPVSTVVLPGVKVSNNPVADWAKEMGWQNEHQFLANMVAPTSSHNLTKESVQEREVKKLLASCPVTCPKCQAPATGLGDGKEQYPRPSSLPKLAEGLGARRIAHSLEPCGHRVSQEWAAAFAAEINNRRNGLAAKNVPPTGMTNIEGLTRIGNLCVELAKLYEKQQKFHASDKPDARPAIDYQIVCVIDQIFQLCPDAELPSFTIVPSIMDWADKNKLQLSPKETPAQEGAEIVGASEVFAATASAIAKMAAETSPVQSKAGGQFFGLLPDGTPVTIGVDGVLPVAESTNYAAHYAQLMLASKHDYAAKYPNKNGDIFPPDVLAKHTKKNEKEIEEAMKAWLEAQKNLQSKAKGWQGNPMAGVSGGVSIGGKVGGPASWFPEDEGAGYGPNYVKPKGLGGTLAQPPIFVDGKPNTQPDGTPSYRQDPIEHLNQAKAALLQQQMSTDSNAPKLVSLLRGLIAEIENYIHSLEQNNCGILVAVFPDPDPDLAAWFYNTLTKNVKLRNDLGSSIANRMNLAGTKWGSIINVILHALKRTVEKKEKLTPLLVAAWQLFRMMEQQGQSATTVGGPKPGMPQGLSPALAESFHKKFDKVKRKIRKLDAD